MLSPKYVNERTWNTTITTTTSQEEKERGERKVEKEERRNCPGGENKRRPLASSCFHSYFCFLRLNIFRPSVRRSLTHSLSPSASRLHIYGHFSMMSSLLAALFTLLQLTNSMSRLKPRVLLPSGVPTHEHLQVCPPSAVCNKVDTYSSPWVEKQCKCPGETSCSSSLSADDGFTVLDKSRQFKMCEPVDHLTTCRYFRDVTWTLTSYPDNRTSQLIHCTCPANSVAYIFRHEAFETESGTGYKYQFACSPESKLRCQRKEPCRLFTVRKRPDVEEVNTNTLCQCPRGSQCPAHHSESSVISGTTYPVDHIKTYTGFCHPEY